MLHFQLVERAAMFPQLCMFCRRYIGAEKCLDTGQMFPGDEGRMYSCLSCIDDILTALGLLRAHEAALLRENTRDMEAMIDRLPKAIEGMISDARNSLDRAQRYLRDSDAGAGGDNVPRPPVRKPRKPASPGFTDEDLDATRVTG